MTSTLPQNTRLDDAHGLRDTNEPEILETPLELPDPRLVLELREKPIPLPHLLPLLAVSLALHGGVLLGLSHLKIQSAAPTDAPFPNPIEVAILPLPVTESIAVSRSETIASNPQPQNLTQGASNSSQPRATQATLNPGEDSIAYGPRTSVPGSAATGMDSPVTQPETEAVPFPREQTTPEAGISPTGSRAESATTSQAPTPQAAETNLIPQLRRFASPRSRSVSVRGASPQETGESTQPSGSGSSISGQSGHSSSGGQSSGSATAAGSGNSPATSASASGSGFSEGEAAGTGNASSGSSGATLDEMRAYADRVDQEVKQQWDNMRQEMGTIPDDASVTVNFSVDRNGQMVNPEVIVNSDSPEVNAAAVEALQRANFEPLPDNYQGEEFRLQEEMSIEKVN